MSLGLRITVEFQFQYGAIEGVLCASFHHPSPEFQFQYGAIEGAILNLFTKQMTEFQFQYGAIEGQYAATLHYPSAISIPVWCD